MPNEYIMSLERLTRMYDEKEVLSDVSLAFFHGAKIGVLGVNGSGKSTLLRILAGEDTDYMGEVRPAKNIRIGYFRQEPQLDPEKTVAECIDDAVAEQRATLDRYTELNMKLAEELSDDAMQKVYDELDRVQSKIDAENLWDLDRNLEIAKDAMRLPPDDAVIENLSGGEKRRVSLCALLLEQPDLLLLDEPTNHLDAESVAWLERFLESFKGTVVAVTHDRYFLDNVAGWILELDRGRGYPYEGNYAVYLEKKAKRMELESRSESKRQKTLKRELEWVRMSPKARATKNKARLDRYNELASQEYDVRDDSSDIQIPVTRPLGDRVLTARGLTKAYGDKLLFEDLDFELPPGGIVGVIGPNGAGKTTLFRMIVGDVEPDAGSIKLGETVDLAYVDQSRDALAGNKTVYQEISGDVDILEIGKAKIHARTYVGRFNFKGTEQQKFVRDLSGGERNRVHLAKLLRSGGNLLILDEPTNDLDVETLRSLEEGLSNFGGCAVVSSHDRYFLDRVATHILAFEGESQVVFFEGNYKMYEASKKQRLGEDALQPHRIRYRPLAK